MSKQINIGQLIKEEIERQDQNRTNLAKESFIDRRQLYRIYNRKSIDTDILFNLSVQLKHDFFKLYSEELTKKIAE